MIDRPRASGIGARRIAGYPRRGFVDNEHRPVAGFGLKLALSLSLALPAFLARILSTIAIVSFPG